MKKCGVKKLLGIAMAVALSVTSLMGTKMSPFATQTVVSAAASSEYAAQLVRVTIADGTRNLNPSGYSAESSLNTIGTSGGQNENWRFDYIKDGVFRIVNMGNGMILSPKAGKTTAGTSCVITPSASKTYQYWNVSAVSKDSLGNDLYYKITNYADSSKALTYNASNNTITLANYTGNNTQKFLLNTAGLQGFASYGKDINGRVKASNIGGLLGQTVYVSSYSELLSAASSTAPKTIVITKNISYGGSYSTDSQKRRICKDKLNVNSNKTIIGSYAANTLSNLYVRPVYGSGNNIIIRNITLKHDEACNSENTWEFYSGVNLWLDHITFVGHSKINTARTGGDIDKFIAIKGTSDYATISDCSFGKHEYGVLMGYPEDTDNILKNYKGKPCITMLTNYFNGCVTRGPGLMRYGYFHCLNNYAVNFDMAYTMHTAATVYTEKNYFDGGSGNGSVVNDNALSLTQVSNASISKVGPWFTDNGSVARNCYKNNNVSNIKSAKTSWRPSGNYTYSAMDAYSVPNYCKSNAGAKTYANAMKYGSFAKTGVPSAFYLTTGTAPTTAPTTTPSPSATVAGSTLDTNQVYMLKNVNSGLYMNVEGGKAAKGTNIQQWGATKASYFDSWKFVNAGNGYYKIISQVGDASTYVMDVAGRSVEDGANIGLYTDNSGNNQLFKPVKNSDGTYSLRTKISNDVSCIEVANSSKSSGGNIQQSKFSGASNQKWILVKASDMQSSPAPSTSATPSPSVSVAPTSKPTPSTNLPQTGNGIIIQASGTSWNGGYNMNLTLKNTSKSTISNWKLYLKASDVDMTSIWCATKTVSGNYVVVTPESYAQNIAADGSVSFGFGANGTMPSAFSYKLIYTSNGVECTSQGVARL